MADMSPGIGRTKVCPVKDYDSMSENPAVPRVYHYTPETGFKGIIQNQEIWATSIYCVEDDREFFHGQEQIIKNMGHLLTGDEAEAAEVILRYLIQRQPDLFVCSFTNADDSPDHWKKFAGDRGYAIGIPLVELMNHAGCGGFHVCACRYDPMRPEVCAGFVKIVREVISLCGGLDRLRSQFPFSNPLLEMCLKSIMAYKRGRYRDEKETRLVYYIPQLGRECTLDVRSEERDDGSTRRYVAFSLKKEDLWKQADIVVSPCSGDKMEGRLEWTKAFLREHDLPNTCVDSVRPSMIPGYGR